MNDNDVIHLSRLDVFQVLAMYDRNRSLSMRPLSTDELGLIRRLEAAVRTA